MAACLVPKLDSGDTLSVCIISGATFAKRNSVGLRLWNDPEGILKGAGVWHEGGCLS